MEAAKPKTAGADYLDWLQLAQNCPVTRETQGHYERVTEKVKSVFAGSEFWTTFTGRLREIDNEYLQKTGLKLLMVLTPPDLYVKPYNSFIEKTFRKNVLENRIWQKDNDPVPPHHGWYLPDRCHERINDLVRTTVVVKYLDGVPFLWSKIKELADSLGLYFRIWYEARDEGYYGAHIYVEPSISVPGRGVNDETKQFQIEIQISTQLKEVLRDLTHPYHEKRRMIFKKPSEKWQWDHSCEEFVPNYLGHILHYVEGMLMQMRDKHREGG